MIERQNKFFQKCQRKVRHSTPDAAWTAASNTKAQPGCRLVPYFCEFCNGWHVGNAKAEPKSGSLFKGKNP